MLSCRAVSFMLCLRGSQIRHVSNLISKQLFYGALQLRTKENQLSGRNLALRQFTNTHVLGAHKVWRVGKDKYENLPAKDYLIAAWKVDIKRMRKRMNLKPILGLDVKEDIRPRLEIIVQAGVDEAKIGRIITRQPKVLLVNIPDLLIRINTMRRVGIHSDEIPRIIEDSPSVLTNTIEKTLYDKIAYIQNLPVKPPFTEEDALTILSRCPAIISNSTIKAMEEKMHVFTEELRTDKQQLRNLIYRQPNIMTFNASVILEKYKYCRSEMGLKKAHIMRCPRVFLCSMKRIKERHLFLKSLSLLKEDTPIDDFGLGIIVTFTDTKFVEVAKSSIEEFQKFTATLEKKKSVKKEEELDFLPDEQTSIDENIIEKSGDLEEESETEVKP